MATLTVQSLGVNGLKDHTYASAAGGGDVFPNDGKTLFKVRNTAGGANAQTVTLNSQTNCNQGFDHDVAIAIDFGEEVIAGPFPPARFNNSAGQIAVTYSGVTNIEVAALRMS